jgi:ATP-dependent 26S proteasome regulatory subunit
MTSTNTNINIPQSLNSIQLNPHDYVNKGLNDIVQDYYNFNHPKKSIKTLFIGVGVLIGVDIFKSIVQNIIKENKESINKYLMNGIKLLSFSSIKYNFYYTKYYLMNSIWSKNTNEIINNNCGNFLFEINCDEVFFNNLIMLLENYKKNKSNYELINDISFFVEQDNSININQSNTTLNKKLIDIKINYDDNFIIQINNLIYEYNYNGNSIAYVNNTSSLYIVFSKKYDDLLELYNFYENNNIFVLEKDKIKLSNMGKSLTKKNITIDLNESSKNGNIEMVLRKIYEENNQIHNINIIMVNLYIFSLILNNPNVVRIDGDVQELKQFMKDKYNITNYNWNNFVDYNNFIRNKLNVYMGSGSGYSNTYGHYKFVQECNLIFEDEDKSSGKIKINFIIKKKLNYSKIEANEKIINFISYVSSISKKHRINKKINIFTITTKVNNIIEKIDNPEYDEYMDVKSNLINENKNITNDEILKLLGKQPEMYIINRNKKYEIEKNVVNTKYCSFENLYLRKQQDIQLFNLVNRFLNDKKLMEQLNIPNKLGLLLYGEPGCGKTTTIITIASYLGRDIFYVNLKSIKTNEELKIIFDYINLQHSGGGIVVLEDIDAMTDIVMDRRKSNPINPNIFDTNISDSISFEYLLNICDGTLTYNESVIIITTNHLDKLDPALYRLGRIDNLIEMKKCDHYQISKIFKRFIDRDIKTEILQRIQENKFTPADIIFNLINWVKKREQSDDIIMSNFIDK